MVRTQCQWQDRLHHSHHLNLCMVVEPSHLLQIFPGHQLKLLMASLGRFNCTKQKLALECAMGTSIPSKAPDMLERAQSTKTPLCFSHLEWGEAAAESGAGAFPFPLMSHWGAVGAISLFFFSYVFPFCLANNKRSGLPQPKFYWCPWASRFLAGYFWVFGEVTPTDRGFRWDLSSVMLRQNCMKCSLVINLLEQGSQSPTCWVNMDFSAQQGSCHEKPIAKLRSTACAQHMEGWEMSKEKVLFCCSHSFGSPWVC